MNKETAINRLICYLKSHKKNISQERLIILNAIFRHPVRRHFKVEDLVRKLANGPQSVSRATIYRTLPIFEYAKIVRSMPGNCQTKPQKNYEILDQNPDHSHLVCRICGQITKYYSRTIIEQQEVICRQHGFQPEKRIEQIYGICRQCQK